MSGHTQRFNDRHFERLIFFPCFRGSPDRCAQENKVLNEELARIPKHWKPAREMECSRRGEQKTHCKQESDDSSDAANERELCRERPQCDQGRDSDLNRSDQIGNSLKISCRFRECAATGINQQSYALQFCAHKPNAISPSDKARIFLHSPVCTLHYETPSARMVSLA